MLISTLCIFAFAAGMSSTSAAPSYGSYIEGQVLPLFVLQPVDEKFGLEGSHAQNGGTYQGTVMKSADEELPTTFLRVRNEASPDEDQTRDSGRGRFEAEVNRDGNRGTGVDARVTGRTWDAQDGNGRLEAHGPYGRFNGGEDGTGSLDNGGSINYSRRFRREADPQFPGTFGVGVHQHPHGTRFDANLHRAWETRNGRGRLEVLGNYGQFIGGRPDYGASITYTHRFRREAIPDQDQQLIEVD